MRSDVFNTHVVSAATAVHAKCLHRAFTLVHSKPTGSLPFSSRGSYVTVKSVGGSLLSGSLVISTGPQQFWRRCKDDSSTTSL